jgi:DNA-binding NtrC family response regulator
MPETKARVLIVDDEPSIRVLLSQLLVENGYGARSTPDGLSALDEIRREAPEILLSDLNMPGMSGFELLQLVRRRFPQIHLIAMSGSFSGDKVPSGVIADAFYQKGASVDALLKMIESLPRPERVEQQQPQAAPAPVWIARSRRNAAGESHAVIECPECLRTFSQVLNGTINPVSEANCRHCGTLVLYTIVQPDDGAVLLPFHLNRPFSTPGIRPMQKLVL